MSYWLTSFAGVSLQTNLGDQGGHDIGVGQVPSQIVALPGGFAYDANTGKATPIPSSRYAADILLVSSVAATLKGYFDGWMALKGQTGVLVRTGDDATTHTITARLVEATSRRTVADVGFLKLHLVFEAVGNIWEGAAQTTTKTMGASTVGAHATITQGGNVDLTDPVITVTAGSGAMTVFTWGENSISGTLSTWTGSVAAGQVLQIQCGPRTVTNNNVDAYAGLVPGTAWEYWMHVATGGGTSFFYRATYTGTAPTVVIAYNDWWAG